LLLKRNEKKGKRKEKRPPDEVGILSLPGKTGRRFRGG